MGLSLLLLRSGRHPDIVFRDDDPFDATPHPLARGNRMGRLAFNGQETAIVIGGFPHRSTILHLNLPLPLGRGSEGRGRNQLGEVQIKPPPLPGPLPKGARGERSRSQLRNLGR